MRRTLLITLGVLVLAACGGGAAVQHASSASSTAREGQATKIGVAAPGAAPGTAVSDATVLPPVPVAPSDKLIRTARVTLEVGSGRFDETLTSLVALAAREQGFVSASSATSTDGRLRTGVFTFSVPSDQFEATIAEVRRMGTVQSLDVASQDVGAQYVDLQARLQNAQAQRDAMLALLQQAKSVPDIIAVQTQLGQITAQVEQLKGQIGYLDHATAYSTIAITLREAGVVEAPPSDATSLRDAVVQGLHAFVLSLAAILMVVVATGPYLLLVAGAIFIWRIRRRPARVRTE